MKSLLIGITLLSSFSAFSQVSGEVTPATKKEKAILCKSIAKALKGSYLDIAVDSSKCLKTKMTSRLVSEGILEISGKVPFNSPERSYKIECSVSYYALNNELVAKPSCH